MNPATNLRNALKASIYARRSFRGSNVHKGAGKRAASKADRRASKALVREEG
jgi:hypothetical protein